MPDVQRKGDNVKKPAKKKAKRKVGTITHIRRVGSGFAFRQFGYTITVTTTQDPHSHADCSSVVITDKNGDVVDGIFNVDAHSCVMSVARAIDKARELAGWKKTEGWART